MAKLSDLQPGAVWDFFERITRIPRPSKHEEKIREWLIGFAKERGLEYRTDKTGNVTIIKPATSDAAAVVLQSHMDMVCEKNAGVSFDFGKDPIRVRTEAGWVMAEGTTLGADDGIGMAAALAVLDAKDLEHGRIEALFTVDEETGLTGAFGLGDDMISAGYLINLDSEDEGEIFIGCAGGVDTLATFEPEYEPAPKDALFFRISVSGLKGGHSGDNINDGLANSNKLLARILLPASQQADARLASIDGGNLRNAIPREASAVVVVKADAADALREIFNRVGSQCKAEFALTEPGMSFRMEEAAAAPRLFDRKTQGALLDAIQGTPNGVLAMSRSMPGLVETSSNLASVKETGEGRVVVTSSQRSSVESAKWDAATSVEAVFRLAGAHVAHSEGYPGWAPDPSSRLLECTVKCYEKLFGAEPKVRAIHAGLECGLFLEKYPGLEMVSFGPTLRGVHSPDERLEIASVEKFWKLLVRVIKDVK